MRSWRTWENSTGGTTTPRLDKVFLVFIDGDRGRAFGIARNISKCGMLIETRAPEQLGSQVRITFPSREGDMSAVAEVRYVFHLICQLGSSSRHSVVRGMRVCFLYFEAAGTRPLVLH
ncbi:MAG TPA: PilZ domain-containing protein [Anaeromyxobacteraceae bacterium]|nr:PilZ domain-containing protein [Anaeromyxobacteraceae bacterium]